MTGCSPFSGSSVFLAPLYALISQFVAPGMTRSVAFVLAVGFISHLLEMPFSLANSFWLEERFGFNRLTPAMFFIDEIKSVGLGLAIGAPLALWHVLAAWRSSAELVALRLCRLHGV